MNSASILDQLFDIYGIVHVPWWQKPIVKYIQWLVVALIVMGIVTYSIKKILRRKKTLTPWQQALESFGALKKGVMLNQREAKFFYTHLTSILKHYIFGRYGYDIYGKTDRELLSYLDDQVAFPRDLLPVLSEILDHASAIKFANLPGLVEQMERDLALSVTIVQATIPVNRPVTK